MKITKEMIEELPDIKPKLGRWGNIEFADNQENWITRKATKGAHDER